MELTKEQLITIAKYFYLQGRYHGDLNLNLVNDEVENLSKDIDSGNFQKAIDGERDAVYLRKIVTNPESNS